jgi:replicative DNA helicase
MCGRKSGEVAGFKFLGKAKKDEQFALYRREGDPRLAERDRPAPGNWRPNTNGQGKALHATHAVNWEVLARRHARNLTPELRRELADYLGLPEATLATFPLLGFDPEDRKGPCWTFPEVDAAGRVTGLNRRYRDGDKKAAPGSLRGLTVPQDWDRRGGDLYLPEGPSDVLALTAMGLAAVGRPSNLAGVELLAELLKDVPAERVIVVLGEYDPNEKGKWSGLEGAVKTAEALAEKLGRPVSWALPPDKAKDARAWLTAQKPDVSLADEWGDMGQRFAAGLSPQEAGKPAKVYGYTFRIISSAEFDVADYQPHWLVKRVLVEGQPGVIGGPLKCMKTSTSVDLCVSLASGTPFLGHFPVYRRVRTVLLSGESGPYGLQSCAWRVCEARGIRLADCDLHWGFQLPRVTNVQDLLSLEEGLKECGAEVAVLDPLYLILLSGGEVDASAAANLYATGPLLLAVAESCLRAGVTPIICHHFRRSVPPPPAIPELHWLSHSGVAEFARQWLLLSRREEYDPDSGLHRLHLVVGGSTGHSGLYALDIDEGRLADDFGGRRWQVTVQSGCAAHRAGAAEQKERGDRDKEARLLSALDTLAAKSADGIAVYSQVRALAGLNNDAMTRAVLRLVEAQIIEEVPVQAAIGSKAMKTVRGLRRRRSATAEAK